MRGQEPQQEGLLTWTRTTYDHRLMAPQRSSPRAHAASSPDLGGREWPSPAHRFMRGRAVDHAAPPRIPSAPEASGDSAGATR